MTKVSKVDKSAKNAKYLAMREMFFTKFHVDHYPVSTRPRLLYKLILVQWAKPRTEAVRSGPAR